MHGEALFSIHYGLFQFFSEGSKGFADFRIMVVLTPGEFDGVQSAVSFVGGRFQTVIAGKGWCFRPFVLSGITVFLPLFLRFRNG